MDPLLELKRRLAAEIVRSLGEGSQHVISRHFGISQPRMSELNRGVVDRCSMDWLIRRIHRLGGTVTVAVTVGDARREWMRGKFLEMRARRGEADRR